MGSNIILPASYEVRKKSFCAMSKVVYETDINPQELISQIIDSDNIENKVKGLKRQ